MSLEVALLDVSSDDVHAAENFKREVPVPVTAFDVTDEEFPSDGGADFDATVISGSWASVCWDLDWLSPLKDWVASAIDRGMPVFGVWFGYQLLADVLGGDVESCDAYELGFHPIEHADDTLLFEGIDREFLAFTPTRTTCRPFRWVHGDSRRTSTRHTPSARSTRSASSSIPRSTGDSYPPR